MKICVVGLGNIGFNLLDFIQSRYPGQVVGIDIDQTRVEALKKSGYKVFSNYKQVDDVDIWLMALSTGKYGQNLFAALDEMTLKQGALISIESTLPLGTMEKVRSYFEEKGYVLGRDIYLITIPHRIMFGVDETVCDTPRVIGSFTQACMEKGKEFYSPLVPELVETQDIRIAELSKVVENVKRYVDVAFAQEIYRYCIMNNLDFDGLRKAVNSKSNIELLGSDWGIGGECLPKDMGFLRTVFDSHLLEGAEKADLHYRKTIIDQVGQGQTVLVDGVTFKPGVKDLKHSRGMDLVKALIDNRNTVWVKDAFFTPEELADAGLPPYQGQPCTVVLQRGRALEPCSKQNNE